MPTLPSTVKDFNNACCKFHEKIGIKTHTQEQIAAAYRALILTYLGLEGVTDAQLQECADLFQLMTLSARARGWEV